MKANIVLTSSNIKLLYILAILSKVRYKVRAPPPFLPQFAADVFSELKPQF